MKKIRVLQIGGNTQINGITTFLLDFYRKISNKFEFVFINCALRESNETIKNEILKLGGKIYHVPFSVNYQHEYQAYLEELRKVIQKEKPLIIQTNYYKTNGLYLKLAFEEGIPIRISYCMNDKSKYLPEQEILLLEQSRELVEIFATAKLAISNEAGQFIYGNNSFEVLHPLINFDKFYTITNKADLYVKYNLDSKIKYSLFVGRFAPQKNIYFLIDVIEKCRDNRKLIMVGNGIEKGEFLKRIEARKLNDKFIFFETDNPNDFYNLSDSFILPSWYEGLGIVLIEAQLLKLPCLASDSISKEVNLGLCKFLKLDADLWVKELDKIESFPRKQIDLQHYTNTTNLDKIISIYTNNTELSEQYIRTGKEYMLGSNRVLNDWNMVFKYFEMAHKLGNIKGTFYYALLFFEGHGTNRNVKYAHRAVSKIVNKIEKRANDNNPDYVVILADMYSFGLGKAQNFAIAFYFYQKAAELGNSEAMCNLGYMYLVGQGTEKDLKKSFYWYKKSAENNYLHSIRDLGQSYYNGFGTKANYFEAVECFKLASEQNYSHATSDLAICYLEGKGVKKDWNKAAELFLMAIRQERNRAIRDIIAYNIDVDYLLNNKKICFIKRKSINKTEDIDKNVLLEQTIIINKDIEYINPKVFYEHKEINKFFVEKENKHYHAYNGVLYSKDKKTLIRFPMGSTIKEFFIPIHVTTIGDSAFDDCKNLKSIIIPDSVKEIGDWAFHGCDKITEIFLSKNIKKIGRYSFGSCERLRKIDVDINNETYKSLDGNLFSKDLKYFYQYSIGKRANLFALPQNTEIIKFRAFSDAFNLRLIDASNVKLIEEKAFYYCKRLKSVLINKNTVINGKEIFGHTAFNFKSKNIEKGRTILVADIHGYMRLDFLKSKLSKYCLQKNDVVIILGDAGIVWSNPMNEQVKDFYSKLPCNILFLDGNHENFDLLSNLKTCTMYGSKVHRVLNNVFHLLRGNVYIINCHKYFIFGGAYSIKRDFDNSPVQIWQNELPNEKDFKHGLFKLKENNWTFDFILTHQAPKTILDRIEYEYSTNEITLLNYLDMIKNKANYKSWYFGHIHRDLEINKFKSLYHECEVIL